MSERQCSVRFVLLGAIAFGILAGCIPGESDDAPSPTPIVIVPTATPTLESTPTDEPTATIPATSTPTPQPSPTSAPTATAQPTLVPRPTRTPIDITIPTPVPDETSTGGLEIPADLLEIMPQPEDGPPGLVLFEEGQASLELVAADAADSAARAQQLTEWGFQDAAFRELRLADDQITDPDSQLLTIISYVVLLGSPETAQLEMQTHRDEIVMADPEISMTTVEIEPLGEQSSAAFGSALSEEGNEFQLAVVWVTAGPLSLRFVAASGPQYDPIPDLVQVAQATLAKLGFSGVPGFGEVVFETDFSNWPTQEFDFGSLAYGDDGLYHVIVTDGGGSYVSAYSIDHEPFTDVAVSVDLRMVAGDPSTTGCVMTRIDQVSQLYDYALCIDGNGNIEVLYEAWDSEGNYTSEAILPAGQVAVAPPTEWLTLTIVARGEEFWFLANGELVGTATHTGPPGGSAGVIVNHFIDPPETPAEFTFTNLVVQALE
jgi:hypothetical protein